MGGSISCLAARANTLDFLCGGGRTEARDRRPAAMKILALELSSGQGSIAWREDGRDLEAMEFPNDRKHSGLFFENLERSLAQFGNPDRIVVGLGPGSYAGTRIAIATATGLQVAADSELLGFPL